MQFIRVCCFGTANVVYEINSAINKILFKKKTVMILKKYLGFLSEFYQFM